MSTRPVRWGTPHIRMQSSPKALSVSWMAVSTISRSSSQPNTLVNSVFG